VLDYGYNFSLGTADNGNVTGITNNRDTTRSQSFTYDLLNRVATAVTTSTYATSRAHCWGEAFSYDAWGNLQVIGGASSAYTGCTQESLSVSATTKNQLSGYGYDATGNMTSIPSVATYTYNAEGQMTSAAGVTYTYDGDGRRVSKSNGKLYWYGMGSDPLDETDLAGNTNNSGFNEYIFFAGKRIARRDSSNNVTYYFADHLGTARVVTNSSGAILDDSDFYPFGGERPIVSSSGNTYKFTSKERDSESGLDDFGARYYSSALGRFVSSDWSAIPVRVPYAELTNPQTLNLYTFVKNNPLHFTDPTGHGAVGFDGLGRSSSNDGGLPTADSEGEELTTEAQDEQRLAIEIVTVTIGGPASEQQPPPQPQNQTSSVETATREILFPVDLDPTSGTVAMQSVQIQGRVDYHGHQVSDPAIRAELMEISFATGQAVNVTSGDRNFVPRGGAKNSEHLKGHAADFHIGGTKDSAAFAKIGGNHLLPNGFKLIQHGQHTITEGPHLHLDTSPGRGAPSRYVTEGLTPQTRGIYTVVQP
jgi:RHS repeat-associated protein